MSIWVVVHKEQSKVLNFSNLDYLEAVLLLSDSVNSYTILLIPLTPTFICILNLSLSLSFSLCLVSQSCLTLCNPMDCSLPGSSFCGDFPGKNTGVGCHALLQGIFPTRGLNPGLPHCRQILYNLSQNRETPSICLPISILYILFHYYLL